MVRRLGGAMVRAIKAFFSRLFPNQRDRFSPNGVQGRPGSGGGFFNNSQNIVIQNSTMIQADIDKITQAMKLLSKHIIFGAAHDSSARVPPPRCHPGTRVKLNERMTTWFYDKKRQRLLLWVTGPAGVGKSAVIQTFAESLAISKRLGASVFFSRPNKRNDPQGAFITIAYQLAVRIEAYRIFIAERLALDPDLLNKEIGEQFRIFIAEPFGERRIGAGGEVWGVLLDGLDELKGQRLQREIIRLISAFVLKHPEVPLVWVIASRPEPHISDTFSEEEIVPSYWQEYIPVDSTEACEDVERFLRASFKTIRKDFPRSVPRDWPSEAAFLKLASAASGLFVFPAVAIRFIEDADRANPVSQLDLVLSTIDRSKVILPEDQPFAHLDALYTQILISIPPSSWPTAKRLLGFSLCSRGDESFGLRPASRSLKGMSVILNLEQDVIYTSLNNCYSVLEIPSPKDAYSKSVTFFHASFVDYLTDSTRSKDFYVCLEDAMDDVLRCLFNIWQDFAKQLPTRSKYSARWQQYCSRYHSKTHQMISRKTTKEFNTHIYDGLRRGLFHIVTGSLKSIRKRGPFVSQQDRSECLDILSQVDIAKMWHNFGATQKYGFVNWLFRIWEGFPGELMNRDLVRVIKFKELKFKHLDCERMCPSHCEVTQVTAEPNYWSGASPRSPTELHAYVSKLESFQRQWPGLQVLICGSTPESRCALFCYEYSEEDKTNSSDAYLREGYYLIPYPC